ncbi:MAG TPA: transcriptional regulator [Gammaproteobacteria bacterium]|nr:transcriptional regulator [Gammaproteobacteria bacterium]
MPRIVVGEIDNVIHGRLRLGIMAYLADTEVADFSELKRVLEATQGNLGANLVTLEQAGYITIEKKFAGRKPLTRAHITRKGREAFRRYMLQMAALVESGLGKR